MVEKWLLQVEDVMINSVRKVSGESVEGYKTTSRDRWVMEWPGQIVICVSSIYWTADVERAMKVPNGVAVCLIHGYTSLEYLKGFGKKIKRKSRITWIIEFTRMI